MPPSPPGNVMSAETVISAWPVSSHTGSNVSATLTVRAWSEKIPQAAFGSFHVAPDELVPRLAASARLKSSDGSVPPPEVGETEFEALLSGELPMLFVACTVKVYDVPAVRPD